MTKPQTLAEQPVEWRSINTAPRGGEWFFARTIRGTIRYVHFADKYDRFPISHDGVVWETAPLEWTLDAAAALADAAATTTPALSDKEKAAYIAGMRQAEKICRLTAQKVTNRVNWAHNCAAFIVISIGEVDDKTMLHYIKSGE